jgi:leucyl-tRNA synthetase
MWSVVALRDRAENRAGTRRRDTSGNARRESLAARQAIHRTVAEFTKDLERFHFNRAFARARELTNALENAGRKRRGRGLRVA